MECNADFCEENLAIFPAEILHGCVPDLFQCLAASNARLSIDASKRQVIVTRLKVASLLLC